MAESDDGRLCPFCSGWGHCRKCDGEGTRSVRRGLLRRARKRECIACRGSGDCALCDGTGRVAD